MHNELTAAVNTAQNLCVGLSKLFYKGDHRAIEGVYLVFAGFHAIEAIASLGRRTGAIYIVPQFEIVDGEVTLKKVRVADGLTYGDTIVHTSCDLIRYPDGSFGLLTDLKGKNIEYRCVNESQLTRRALRRPRNAAKLIERGRRALAEVSEGLITQAA